MPHVPAGHGEDWKMLKTPKLVAIGAGIAAFGGVLGVGIVAAQSSGSSPAANSAAAPGSQSLLSLLEGASPSPSPTGSAKGQPNPIVEDFLQKLATRLGIPLATLKSDLKQTSLDELQTLVTSGKLTQAQADQIKSTIENGNNLFFGLGKGLPGHGKPGGFGGPGGMFGPGLFGIIGQNEYAVANFLGISTTTLQTDLKSGQSLGQIADAQKKPRTDLKTFLTTQLESTLQQLVKNGKMTQTQSDAIRTSAVANLDAIINGQFPMHMRGMGPRDGMRPGGSGAPPSQTPTSVTGTSAPIS